jgi:hypothetical protein
MPLTIDFQSKLDPVSMIYGFIWTLSRLFHVKVGKIVT